MSVASAHAKTRDCVCTLPIRSTLSCFALQPSRAGDQHWPLAKAHLTAAAEACGNLPLFLSSLDLSCHALARSRLCQCAAGACMICLHASQSKSMSTAMENSRWCSASGKQKNEVISQLARSMSFQFSHPGLTRLVLERRAAFAQLPSFCDAADFMPRRTSRRPLP